MARDFSRRIAELAATLIRVLELPENQGTMWSWASVGEVLGCNHSQAKLVVAYIRENCTEFVLTVGTRATDWEIEATRSTRVAWEGMLNQYRHNLTRAGLMARFTGTLATTDQDDLYARAMQRESRWWHRQAEELEDRLEMLVDFGSTG